MQPYLSLVIPTYNERESLCTLHERITETATALDYPWEIIYVDDGSDDGSTDTLRGLQHACSNVIVIVQRRNFGKSLALNAGFSLVRGEIIITMDADLQDEPAEIPRLLAKLDEGYDMVTGWKENRQDPLTKRIPSWIANRTVSLISGLQVHEMNGGLKACRVDCVRHLHLYGEMHRFIPILAHYQGFRVVEIPVLHHKRQFGHSKYGPKRLLHSGFDFLTVLFLNNYNYRPLHFFGLMGFALLAAGFFINFYLSIEWFQGVRPLHDRPLLTLGVLLMVIGAQLLTMGLLAELFVSFIQRAEEPLRTVRHIYRDCSTSPDETP